MCHLYVVWGEILSQMIIYLEIRNMLETDQNLLQFYDFHKCSSYLKIPVFSMFETTHIIEEDQTVKRTPAFV